MAFVESSSILSKIPLGLCQKAILITSIRKLSRPQVLYPGDIDSTNPRLVSPEMEKPNTSNMDWLAATSAAQYSDDAILQ